MSDQDNEQHDNPVADMDVDADEQIVEASSAPRIPLIPDEPDPDDYFHVDEEAARAAALKKRKQIAVVGSGLLLTLVAFMIYSCQPPKGTIMYGACAAFLEQIVSYPPTVEHLYVEQFPRVIRIYFNQTDAFGQFTSDTIECSADPRAYPNLRFEKVLYNRQPVEQEKIDRFNPTIPVIIAAKPDLTLPVPPPALY